MTDAGLGSESLVVYGRRAVLEALRDSGVEIESVLVSRRGSYDDVLDAASARGVEVRRVTPEKVGRVSGHARDDQGVVAVVGGVRSFELGAGSDGLPVGGVLVLDGVTNPGNVGMIMRSAFGLGLSVVLPRAGSPDVGPLVVKASAGVALRSGVWRCDTAASGVALLRAGGFRVLGLAVGGATPLWDVDVPERVAFVLGNESVGLSASVEVDELVSIPMHGNVESLNVAVAAGVVAYELARRRLQHG